MLQDESAMVLTFVQKVNEPVFKSAIPVATIQTSWPLPTVVAHLSK